MERSEDIVTIPTLVIGRTSDRFKILQRSECWYDARDLEEEALYLTLDLWGNCSAPAFRRAFGQFPSRARAGIHHLILAAAAPDGMPPIRFVVTGSSMLLFDLGGTVFDLARSNGFSFAGNFFERPEADRCRPATVATGAAVATGAKEAANTERPRSGGGAETAPAPADPPPSPGAEAPPMNPAPNAAMNSAPAAPVEPAPAAPAASEGALETAGRLLRGAMLVERAPADSPRIEAQVDEVLHALPRENRAQVSLYTFCFTPRADSWRRFAPGLAVVHAPASREHLTWSSRPIEGTSALHLAGLPLKEIP